ncbi:MAG: 6-phosphogluconate dehydrogenase [Erythrobacter sp. RIFCSPHIGHO2_12_FULL_63_10]|nr:MAG: 6-phosphogluconate dehydrogenase [Erythrobacter sp. RIFCSPHIGHO2_12_FULL_63_10]
MIRTLAMIGFGEAGSTFASAMGCAGRAFDLKTDDPATREAMLETITKAGVEPCLSAADALAGAQVVLSLVTASSALQAATDDAPFIAPGALWIDMNSVAPDTKRSAASVIEAAGGRYVDAAVMAPVQPAALAVPLLLSGAHAAEAAQVLAQLGFSNIRLAGEDIGRASTIKMLRSVMVKGIEALTAEMVLAARRAGVADEVLGSLGEDWSQRAEYNLERMIRHGQRRADEMEEVAKTLETLGVEPLMTNGTITRQREMAQ